MRLADFMVRDMEAILVQFEAFAGAQASAANMSALELRDHAEDILLAVAKDLGTPQSRQAQSEKSKGRAPRRFDAPETAAQTHATLRARSGFDINELASEYRALRASVLQLWADSCGGVVMDLDDMIRFNEAIDQALAESIGFFSTQVEQSRNLLLGMLGHDMRSPLQTIQLTATHLAKLSAGEEVAVASGRLVRSGTRMQALLDDLVDFNRTAMGLGINVRREEIDLHHAFSDELEVQRGAHPGRELALEVAGSTRGRWDGLRLQQLLGNLVQNAAKYGDADAPIRVTVVGGDADLRFEVVNRGPAIRASELATLFDPLHRGAAALEQGPSTSLGLGLYIAREIAKAHGGDIHARSDESGTVFSVRLPRGAD